jgi:hypothetical protein
MAPKADLEGLKNTYMALGQIDSGLTSHLEDALERGEKSNHQELKAASTCIVAAQEHIRLVISDFIEKLSPEDLRP